MTMRILVPLDGSSFSEQALPYACEIAQRARAKLHLVRVHPEPSATPAETASAYDGQLDADLLRNANAELAVHAAWATRAYGVSAHSLVLSGPILQSLATYIIKEGIDLVVMTTHGRSGLSRAMLGSVADALLRTVSVPVLLLRPHSGEVSRPEPLRPHRILIPLDGSETSEQIIEPAVELGWLTGARYTLLQVLMPPLVETYGAAVALQISNHDIEHMQEQAHEYLESVADRLRAVGLTVDTRVTMQPVTATAIVDESRADETAMIAMATHGRSGWKRLVLGSVAQQVLHNARMPVLVSRAVTRGTAGSRAEQPAVAYAG